MNNLNNPYIYQQVYPLISDQSILIKEKHSTYPKIEFRKILQSNLSDNTYSFII